MAIYIYIFLLKMAASKRYPVAQAHCLFNIYIQYVARCENSLINVSVYIQPNIFMQIFWMNYCHSLAFIFKARVHSAAEHSQTPIPIPRPNGPWLSGWLPDYVNGMALCHWTCMCAKRECKCMDVIHLRWPIKNPPSRTLHTLHSGVCIWVCAA